MIKIAAIILENDKKEILLYLRDNKPTIPFPNHWDLFGGYVEKGETIEEALVREVKEELDYDLKEYKFFKKYNCSEGDVHKNVKYVYVGKIDKPIEEITLKVGENLKFFPRDEVKDVKFANILKRIVLDYINNK
ncbi:MAG: NUDIX domain-containing protein [Candidatus Moraniibacteriota bacterium]